MFTLPPSATDDELRAAVSIWFDLVASGDVAAAEDFLNSGPESLPVMEFIARVQQFTAGGKVTPAEQIAIDREHVDDLSVDGDVGLVCWWIPGPKSTGKYPGFIGDVLCTIPVDGAWSDLDASFYIRELDGRLSLQLRNVIRFED